VYESTNVGESYEFELTVRGLFVFVNILEGDFFYQFIKLVL